MAVTLAWVTGGIGEGWLPARCLPDGACGAASAALLMCDRVVKGFQLGHRGNIGRAGAVTLIVLAHIDTVAAAGGLQLYAVHA